MIGLFRRDLSIVFRARVTWWMAALSALLVGDGFVRSLQGITTVVPARPLDPMLRGLYIALGVLGPVVGAHALTIEKRRGTFVMHMLQTRSIGRMLFSKWLAGTCGVLLWWLAVLALLGVWRGALGLPGLEQAAVTMVGYLIYAAYVTSLGVTVAAAMPTLRGAVIVALFTIGWNFATDASGSVSALAWMHSNALWSPGTYLARFEHGEIALAAVVWLIVGTSTGIGFGSWGCRFDLRGSQRWLWFCAVAALCAVPCWLASLLPGSWDLGTSITHPPAVTLGAGERTCSLLLAYLGLPGTFLAIGYAVCARRRTAHRALA